MPTFDSIKLFSPSALLAQARSTVLNTLGWMAVLLLTGLIGSSVANSAVWIQIILSTCFVIDFMVFIGAFIYFAKTAPDVLRSERFGIQKLAIERNIVGDSTSGLFFPESIERSSHSEAIDVDAPKQVDHKQ